MSVDTARLQAESLSLAYSHTTIVRDVSLEIPNGAFTAILGANGSGKSTLLRGLSRLHAPATGSVLLDGHSISSMATRDVARTIGVLPQSPIAPGGITVKDLVARGRTPHLGTFKAWSREDTEALDRALAATQLSDLAERQVDSLSGGQRQRAWIALALAQETELLLLDEPTTFLDIGHQYEVLDLLHELAAQGRTIVAVLHDLAQAARYADNLMLMHEGQIIARGAAPAVLTEPQIKQAFDIDVRVVSDPVTNTPFIVPSTKPGELRQLITAAASAPERKS